MHADHTYNIYFFENSETLDNVPEAHIKLPLVVRSKHSFHSWSRYKNKTFFDEGTPGEFEAGEFVVESVTDKNNFLCYRVGEEVDGVREEFDIGYAISRIRKYEEE